MKQALTTICIMLLSLSSNQCAHAKNHHPPKSQRLTTLTENQVDTLINKWVEMWNNYDLAAVDALFARDERLSYFSSEKSGVIRGIQALLEHHRGFGFCMGGKKPNHRLWIEDLHTELYESAAVGTAVWFFEKNTGKRQSGPVTFVIHVIAGKPKFVHMHFANYTPTKPNEAQAISLLGRVLHAPKLDDPTRKKFEKSLEIARNNVQKNPHDAEAIIWYGRRTAYLGEFRKAIDIFSAGIEKHPHDPRLYRHRGHRYITIREFDRAIADFERAAGLIAKTPDTIEPDGMPNERNIPVSTLHTNIWYHLGLAYYLKEDLKNALRAYQECLKISKNNDMLVATTHWMYMTLKKLGQDETAQKLLEPIKKNMDIVENQGYYRLLRFYQGKLTEKELLSGSFSWIDDPGVKYGLGTWYACHRKPQKALKIFKEVIESSNWSTFGHIASEAQLSRM